MTAPNLTPSEQIIAEHFGFTTPERASAAVWAARQNIYVVQPAGWNTTSQNAFDADWNQPLTEAEFNKRVARSVVVPRADLAVRDTEKRAY